MEWSRYNHLFRSKRHGWLLYNSASNTFAQIDDDLYCELLKIKGSPGAYDFGAAPALYLQLRGSGILVDDGGDDVFRSMLKMFRLQNNYDNRRLALTLAPTRACNFACPYCYEKSRDPVFMSDETEAEVVDFIKQCQVSRLWLNWYGGEPLLCFARMRSLTERIKALDIPFDATLITNGYLLDAGVVAALADLRVTRIQVTFDGREATHDARRPLNGGGPTYAAILRNTETLVRGWEGALSLRVNVDHTNKGEYPAIRKELSERFAGLNPKVTVNVYPGIVHDHTESHPDVSCLIDRDQEALWALEGHYRHGLDDVRAYPGRSYNGCIACGRNGFVVGPQGELYKCWDDLGIESRRVGSVKKGAPWNLALIASYMVGSSYLEDPECSECFFLPVCDGGCPRVRAGNLKGGAKRNVCLKFKGHLEELLEVHYEQKQKAAGAPAQDGAETAGPRA